MAESRTSPKTLAYQMPRFAASRGFVAPRAPSPLLRTIVRHATCISPYTISFTTHYLGAISLISSQRNCGASSSRNVSRIQYKVSSNSPRFNSPPRTIQSLPSQALQTLFLPTFNLIIKMAGSLRMPYASPGIQCTVQRMPYASPGIQCTVQRMRYASPGIQCTVQRMPYASPGIQCTVQRN